MMKAYRVWSQGDRSIRVVKSIKIIEPADPTERNPDNDASNFSSSYYGRILFSDFFRPFGSTLRSGHYSSHLAISTPALGELSSALSNL